jgi:hypothetical protein
MKTYARIVSGAVFEIIDPVSDASGNEVPIDERFTPEFVATLVDITDVSPRPDQHWSATQSGQTWTFSPPA